MLAANYFCIKGANSFFLELTILLKDSRYDYHRLRLSMKVFPFTGSICYTADSISYMYLQTLVIYANVCIALLFLL